jgi:hypothetical protein
MKSKVYTSPLAKRILLAVGLVVLPLSVVSQTQAKGPGSSLGITTIAVVSVVDHPGMTINTAAELKARLLHLVLRNARLNPKSVKVLSKGCGCAVVAPQEVEGFPSCMKGCLKDVGVTPVQIIMCGAACAAAETGIGAIVCAVCVGVDVTVVITCAMGCAAYPGPYPGGGGRAMVISRNTRSGHPDRVPRRAKLTAQPARTSS